MFCSIALSKIGYKCTKYGKRTPKNLVSRIWQSLSWFHFMQLIYFLTNCVFLVLYVGSPLYQPITCALVCSFIIHQPLNNLPPSSTLLQYHLLYVSMFKFFFVLFFICLTIMTAEIESVSLVWHLVPVSESIPWYLK